MTEDQKRALRSLADLLEEERMAITYTRRDDGLHVTLDGVEVFVGWMDEAGPLRQAADGDPA